MLKESTLLVCKTLAELAKVIKPGITTADLDKLAEEFIRDNGATPAFKGYNGFPASLCTSVNDQVVHGIPSDKVVLKDGDIISVDCGTFKNGFVGDNAYTFAVGEISDEVLPMVSEVNDNIYMNAKLFERVKAVYDSQDEMNYTTEQKMLLVYFTEASLLLFRK